MTRVPITTETDREKGFTRKNLVTSLLIGMLLGVLGGIPLGWFAHRIYYQQKSGQVLLCRQKHIGQPEAELKALCGSAY